MCPFAVLLPVRSVPSVCLSVRDVKIKSRRVLLERKNIRKDFGTDQLLMRPQLGWNTQRPFAHLIETFMARHAAQNGEKQPTNQNNIFFCLTIFLTFVSTHMLTQSNNFVFDFIPSRFLFVCWFVFFNSFEREWMDWFIFFFNVCSNSYWVYSPSSFLVYFFWLMGLIGFSRVLVQEIPALLFY